MSCSRRETVRNDIFLTHLHVDHYGDLPYLYGFAPWTGRWKPLRLYGPSGRTQDLGTKAMAEGLEEMAHWHSKAFSGVPVGDGYEIEVHEFDWEDDGGICYEAKRCHGSALAAQPRHERRGGLPAGLERAVLRVDGDGRPDELTVQMSEGVDVFVTECSWTCRAHSRRRPAYRRRPVKRRSTMVRPTTTPRATCSSGSSRGWHGHPFSLEHDLLNEVSPGYAPTTKDCS